MLSGVRGPRVPGTTVMIGGSRLKSPVLNARLLGVMGTTTVVYPAGLVGRVCPRGWGIRTPTGCGGRPGIMIESMDVRRLDAQSTMWAERWLGVLSGGGGR
jgi:hypothetical protein